MADNSAYADILNNAKAAIALEYLTLSAGGICITLFVTHIVQGALGSNESIYTLLGKEFNPMKVIRLIRLVVFAFSLILFVLWIQFGLQDSNQYILYRRIIYYTYTILTGLINPIIYNYFLSKVIVKLEFKFKETNTEIPDALLYLKIFKNIFTRSYSIAAAISMFLKVFANEYLSSAIVPCQIVSNLAIFYTSTVLTFYSLYRSAPSQISRMRKKMSSKKESQKKKSNVNLAAAARTAGVFEAPTVVVSK
ncbi:hypothetical protein HDV01_000931 [Terramyces sp. JEL0728]|nr:hypothetical protein HDV01_000931 [Terramyces sp. JEL0728]